MDMKTLVPWGRNKQAPVARFEEGGSPFLALHREMNRLFDDFFQGIDLPSQQVGWSGDFPRLDVVDNGRAIEVTAELPGLDEKDIEITLQDGFLTLKGEKKSSVEGRQYSERWHGRFQRSLQLGSDIDPDRVSAGFHNGLLTITLEKRPEAQKAPKRIPLTK
ncbi:MAG: Hsp20/alpha crystallin family protein [Telmatospirillum sp.]|nr:Hsp20/alpha crystallin family protein [Telmatospirillum sp.]